MKPRWGFAVVLALLVVCPAAAEFRRVLFAHRPPPWAEAIPFRLTPEPLILSPGDPSETY